MKRWLIPLCAVAMAIPANALTSKIYLPRADDYYSQYRAFLETQEDIELTDDGDLAFPDFTGSIRTEKGEGAKDDREDLMKYLSFAKAGGRAVIFLNKEDLSQTDFLKQELGVSIANNAAGTELVVPYQAAWFFSALGKGLTLGSDVPLALELYLYLDKNVKWSDIGKATEKDRAIEQIVSVRRDWGRGQVYLVVSAWNRRGDGSYTTWNPMYDTDLSRDDNREASVRLARWLAGR